MTAGLLFDVPTFSYRILLEYLILMLKLLKIDTRDSLRMLFFLLPLLSCDYTTLYCVSEFCVRIYISLNLSTEARTLNRSC